MFYRIKVIITVLICPSYCYSWSRRVVAAWLDRLDLEKAGIPDSSFKPSVWYVFVFKGVSFVFQVKVYCWVMTLSVFVELVWSHPWTLAVKSDSTSWGFVADVTDSTWYFSWFLGSKQNVCGGQNYRPHLGPRWEVKVTRISAWGVWWRENWRSFFTAASRRWKAAAHSTPALFALFDVICTLMFFKNK